MEVKSKQRGFLYGGLASCIAEGATIPLDVVKVRMQLESQLRGNGSGSSSSGSPLPYTNARSAFTHIIQQDGMSGLFRGLSPALLRQASYGTLRIGLYNAGKQHLEEDFGISGLRGKVLAGVLSGGLSAMVCNPTDLIKVRMQADGARLNGPPSYRNIPHAFESIVREEGVRGLYKGSMPTAARASVVAAAELASYDEIKRNLMSRGIQDGFPLQVTTSLISGFMATLCSSPFDVVKSRILSQPYDGNGKGIYYAGPLDCFKQSLKNEGFRFMWRGFWPNYLNKGPTVVLFFVTYEQIKQFFDAF